MFKPGLPELIVIFVVVFLLFGAKALPEIARGLGKAIKNFKKGLHEITNDEKKTS
ncbi:Twin-arginine translocation protein TatA [hydrothermal vent metagenome]|uniref:Twin-arginine translocation protein TatA n=1 Tax=hydrothermal vent metagenome TaxID=652676 RepID=A0A3B1DKY4_9ZZZZ